MRKSCRNTHSNNPRFEKLEDRVVLDASFQLTGSQFVLNGWDASDTMTISENAVGNTYVFELSSGSWQGTDGSGISGAGTSQLLASKAAVQSLANGIHAGQGDASQLFDTIFESVDFTGLTGPLIIEGLAIQQANGSTVMIPQAWLLVEGPIDFSQSLTVNQLRVDSPANVTLATDSDVEIVGENHANQLSITATGNISFSNQATMRVESNAFVQAGGNIELGRSVPIGTPSPLRFQQTVRMEAAGDLYFHGNSSRLSFDAGGSVEVIERSALILTGDNRAGTSLSLQSFKAMVDDHGTSIVANSLTTEGKYVLLGDVAQGTVSIAGKTILNSSEGVYVGVGGNTNFGSLQFQTTGFAHITEDSDMLLVDINEADVLFLYASGTVSDSSDTQLLVDHNLIIDAHGIILAMGSQNRFEAGGRVSLVADHSLLVGMQDVQTNPTAATVKFGQLNFSSGGYTTINESDGMYLVGMNQADHLDLRSVDYILNAAGMHLTVDGYSTFRATGIVLGTHNTDVISLHGEALFAADHQVRVGEPAIVTISSYQAFANIVDVNVDNTDVQTVVQRLNQELPNGWTFNLFNNGTDIRLRTFDANGDVAFAFRFGSTGVISEAVDTRTGRNMLAPSYQGEMTDRVLQWSFWEVGHNAVYDVPGLPPHMDRFNLTQAGTFHNVFNRTVDVDMSAGAGQLDVWSVVDKLWRSEMDPFMNGKVTTLTRTQVLDGGGMLIRRVFRLGHTNLLGQPVTIDSPYLVGWNPFSDSVFDSLAISIDDYGNPDIWWDDSQIPYFPNIPVGDTRGWAMVYDRDQMASTPTMSVVFGLDEGRVHLPDGTTSETRYFNYNSMNFAGGMAINPGIATWTMPTGSIVDQYYLILPGQGIDANTAQMLDNVAAQLPAPQVYHPGAPMNAELTQIANRLATLGNESFTRTDHLGPLI